MKSYFVLVLPSSDSLSVDGVSDKNEIYELRDQTRAIYKHSTIKNIYISHYHSLMSLNIWSFNSKTNGVLELPNPKRTNHY